LKPSFDLGQASGPRAYRQGSSLDYQRDPATTALPCSGRPMALFASGSIRIQLDPAQIAAGNSARV
jgi:hypothetical protein